MEHIINWNKYQINVISQGTGEKILFLHGWPTNALLWQAQVEALKSDYQVIALDWLGYGQSDKPLDHHYTFSSKKEMLNTVLGEILEGEEPITLVGHDLGGPPAILWTAENQARVRRLILLNTMAYTLKTRMEAFSDVLFRAPLIQNLMMSPFGLKQIMKSNTKSGDKGIGDRINRILEAWKGSPMRLKLNTIHQPMHEGRNKELPGLSALYQGLQVEKHLIIAKKDPLCFEHIDKLSKENPEVPVHVIENCGHFIPVDRPAELNATLRKILVA